MAGEDRPTPNQDQHLESGRLLDRLLEVDLDQIFDRLSASPPAAQRAEGSLRAALPEPELGSQDVSLAVLLATVLSQYEDIERLIEGFREAPAEASLEEAVAVVSEAELADPETLSRALLPLHERDRFEHLFDLAKQALDGLEPYELSRRPPGDLVDLLRHRGQLRTVQALVDFLRSLKSAAETFEALEMPRPHIREYLRHLYSMRDWQEMARLVGLLEVAVEHLSPAASPASRASIR